MYVMYERCKQRDVVMYARLLRVRCRVRLNVDIRSEAPGGCLCDLPLEPAIERFGMNRLLRRNSNDSIETAPNSRSVCIMPRYLMSLLVNLLPITPIHIAMTKPIIKRRSGGLFSCIEELPKQQALPPPLFSVQWSNKQL